MTLPESLCLPAFIETAHSLKPEGIHVIYGHGAEAIRQTLSDHAVNWILQTTQEGTGHAVMQALPYIRNIRKVLVLYGDVPSFNPIRSKN